MADARDYVLAIENNKPVAAQIATDTANSKIRGSISIIILTSL